MQQTQEDGRGDLCRRLTWKWLLNPLLTVSLTPSIWMGNSSEAETHSHSLSYRCTQQFACPPLSRPSSLVQAPASTTPHKDPHPVLRRWHKGCFLHPTLHAAVDSLDDCDPRQGRSSLTGLPS